MSNVSQKAILKINDDEFLGDLYGYLKNTKRVKVTGLGVFEIRKMKPRKGYNPGTKTYVVIPAYYKIHFKPTKRLKQLCK